MSPDERSLYIIQTDPSPDGVRELRSYPINEDGSLGQYTVLNQFGQDHRGPQRGIDGMCLDSEGNIVGAAGNFLSGPGPMIYVWTPQGRVLETYPMPVGVGTVPPTAASATPTRAAYTSPPARDTCCACATPGAGAG